MEYGKHGTHTRSIELRQDDEKAAQVKPLVLFATRRPAALALVAAGGQRQQPPIEVRGVPLDVPSLLAHKRELSAAQVLALDVADDPDGAVEACNAIRQWRKELPILAVLCCDRPTLPWHVRSLLNLGVASIVDARVEPTALLAELTGLARGADVLHLELHHWAGVSAANLLTGGGSPAETLTAEDVRLANLVARGRSNRAIGREVHQAASTVQHHIAALCARLSLPNRVALAGWAGALGYVRAAEIRLVSEDDSESSG